MFEILGLLLLLAVVGDVHRGQPEQRHRRTDPACRHYSDAGRLRRWFNNRGRGKSCPECVPPYRPNAGDPLGFLTCPSACAANHPGREHFER